ncbi:hypothetical protein [Paraburkholderia fungorum]|uniref:hypothetical protein n=1 Tax=Paraburkholderia fungorum TaxID=134537 RepID=UPI00248E8831|nr:hypothetical protein [Paraburkholderia fungorum]
MRKTRPSQSRPKIATSETGVIANGDFACQIGGAMIAFAQVLDSKELFDVDAIALSTVK